MRISMSCGSGTATMPCAPTMTRLTTEKSSAFASRRRSSARRQRGRALCACSDACSDPGDPQAAHVTKIATLACHRARRILRVFIGLILGRDLTESVKVDPPTSPRLIPDNVQRLANRRSTASPGPQPSTGPARHQPPTEYRRLLRSGQGRGGASRLLSDERRARMPWIQGEFQMALMVHG